MANSSFVITLSTPQSVAAMGRYLLNSSDPRGEAVALKLLFSKLSDGLLAGDFRVQTSASAPVRATNTLTLTYASITNLDTVVIGGTTLTCVTGTPANNAQFQKQTDATVTARNLVNCVNANPTLSKLVVASSALGVVTLTVLTPGVIGNQVPLVGSTGMVAGGANFSAGAGGAETAGTLYNRS